jgi:hypothetical protein
MSCSNGIIRRSGASWTASAAVRSTVKDLVAGSGLRFREWGRTELKGLPGEWQLYVVAAPGA